jgi:hypothetical protein
MRFMRWLPGGLGLLVSTLALAAPAGAGTLYRWESDDGSIAFSDDPKRIPERYREKAEVIVSEGITGYSRYTPTDTNASRASHEQLTERLDGLRAAAAESEGEPLLAPAPAGSGHPLRGIALQSQRETTGRRLVNTPQGPRWRETSRLQTVDQPSPVLGVNPDPDSDAPVVMERLRARSKDSIVTRHITVVRQGDKVLSVIKPRSRHSSADFPIEEDFER